MLGGIHGNVRGGQGSVLPIIPHKLSSVHFEAVSLTGLDLTKDTRLAGRRVSGSAYFGPVLGLIKEHFHARQFYTGSVDWTQIATLEKQTLRWVISPQP